jgi:hypothetical protein
LPKLPYTGSFLLKAQLLHQHWFCMYTCTVEVPKVSRGTPIVFEIFAMHWTSSIKTYNVCNTLRFFLSILLLLFSDYTRHFFHPFLLWFFICQCFWSILFAFVNVLVLFPSHIHCAIYHSNSKS